MAQYPPGPSDPSKTLFPGKDDVEIELANKYLADDLGHPELEFGLRGHTDPMGVLRVKNGPVHRNLDEDDESGNL